MLREALGKLEHAFSPCMAGRRNRVGERERDHMHNAGRQRADQIGKVGVEHRRNYDPSVLGPSSAATGYSVRKIATRSRSVGPFTRTTTPVRLAQRPGSEASGIVTRWTRLTMT